jgi:uncharacterized cupin superfamily protein
MKRIISKRWGSETILFYGPYLVKRLKLNAGWSTSIHWHNCKTETIIVESGILQVVFDDPTVDIIDVDGERQPAGDVVSLIDGESITIFEGRQSAHAMRSTTGCSYIEASTPHTVDSERVRACDDWGKQCES